MGSCKTQKSKENKFIVSETKCNFISPNRLKVILLCTKNSQQPYTEELHIQKYLLDICISNKVSDISKNFKSKHVESKFKFYEADCMIYDR